VAGAAPAAAQQTPQTYCASLPATSCEVLNVEVSTVAGSNSAWTSPWAYGGIAIIKYCRNQQFRIQPVNAWPYFSQQNFGTVLLNAGMSISGGNTTMCAALP